MKVLLINHFPLDRPQCVSPLEDGACAHGVFRERPEAVEWSESTVPLYKRQALLISSGYPVRSGSVAAGYGETASKDEGGMDRVNRKVV